eukprot:TRINITY_DN36_c1_g1_i2.p1 TRINITY_DN36_c1_g1~~TRINITY_DN36_c1_g1_i2.p1  ORF type:complete len:299 (+),score=71.52 TRINITY_DN36_c1_g1_i2:20-916(+)
MAFDPAHIADEFQNAFKGIGTDEKKLIKLASSYTKEQLLQVSEAYKNKYKVSLATAISDETSFNFKQLLIWLTVSNGEVKKQLIKYSTKGAGTIEKYLIDILAPSSNEEINEIYQHDPASIAKITNDVSSGNFAKVVLNLLKAKRSEDVVVDDKEAEAISETLYKAGEAKLGTDDATFVEIISTRSVPFLKRVSYFYAKNHKHSLEKAVQKETSGNYEDILVALLKDPLEYYTDRLYNAMKGLGTDEVALNYIFSILSRQELKQVAKLFQERHKDTLESFVKGDTSGDYRELLLSLLK